MWLLCIKLWWMHTNCKCISVHFHLLSPAKCYDHAHFTQANILKVGKKVITIFKSAMALSWSSSRIVDKKIKIKKKNPSRQINVLQGYLKLPWNICSFLGRSNKINGLVRIQNGNMLFIFKGIQHFTCGETEKQNIKH